MFLWKEDDDAPEVDARHLFQTYLSATLIETIEGKYFGCSVYLYPGSQINVAKMIVV